MVRGASGAEIGIIRMDGWIEEDEEENHSSPPAETTAGALSSEVPLLVFCFLRSSTSSCEWDENSDRTTSAKVDTKDKLLMKKKKQGLNSPKAMALGDLALKCT